jgi:hypothetical protein
VSSRAVIDACVFFASAAPTEAHHSEAIEFLKQIHAEVKRGELEIYEPAEWLLELFVISNRQKDRRDYTLWSFIPEADPLPVRHVAALTEAERSAFVQRHVELFPSTAPFTKAGDLVYMWTAWRFDCVLVILDDGLLKYNGSFAQVVRPSDYRKGGHA